MQNNIAIGVLIMACLVSLLVGLDKGGLGGALGVLGVPLLNLVLPLHVAAGLLLPVLIVGDIFAVTSHWRRWDTTLFWYLLPGGLVGTLLGTFVLVSAPDIVLRRGLGIFVLLFAAYKLFIEKRITAAERYQRRPWHGWLAGGLSGITSSVAHAGGPPVTVYILLQGIEPRVFVATSALFFAVLNVVKIPQYVVGGVFETIPLGVMALMVPFMPIGVLLGRALAVRVRRDVFERLILILLTISAILLLVGV